MNKSDIPKGHYCYSLIDITEEGEIKMKTCPYWSNHSEHGYQNSGRCSFLNKNDWDSKPITHLWDRVKECDINMGYEDVEL